MASVEERISRAQSRLIDHIARVDLRVRDIANSLSFYRDVVGLQVARQSPTSASLGSPGRSEFLALDSTDVTAPAEATATGLFHVAIRFPTRADLGDALARLVAAGAEIGAGDHLVSEALYIDDPDGNGLELYWDRPPEQWPPPRGESIVPMATLPVDLQSLLNEGRGSAAVGAPAPAGTDVGHVHLQVSDIARTARFYGDEVGLDLTGRLGNQAAFFSSNAYHHHIAANTWRSLNGKPASRESAGLERVVFSVSDDQELDSLRRRLAIAEGAVVGDDDGAVVVRDPDDNEVWFVLG